MTDKYTYRKPEGMWDSVFSDHPFTPILDRAEGIYLYDTEGPWRLAWLMVINGLALP
jgi:hypothetical protein